MKRILFAASECLPFIKTGGLADVIGTLPRALAARGCDVRVIIPKYGRIPDEYRSRMRHVFETTITLGWRNQYLGVDSLEEGGITFYFVDNEFYFKSYVYGEGEFEAERFCYFCVAVMESLPHLGFFPDVIHCHDWQTGYIPLLQRSRYHRLPDYRDIKTVFTIHNLRFQGLSSFGRVEDCLSLGSDVLSTIEYSGGASAMKAAILYSDRITTVSPTYAREIMTPEHGETLDCLLRCRADDVSGILNGIDNDLFNPWTDRAIASRYSKNSIYGPKNAKTPQGKARCRMALMQELGLDNEGPIAAVVSRLTGQKGMDLIAGIVPRLLEAGANLVVLGMGEPRYEQLFNACAERYAGRFAFCSEMNDTLARRIYAGSDMFLMPSAFEPCGISQLIALRYGCVPIVRETGGLADTVQAYNRYEDTGNGFSFANYSAEELWMVTRMALDVYHGEPEAWKRLVKRCMECDNGWGRSAGSYIELYEKL